MQAFFTITLHFRYSYLFHPIIGHLKPNINFTERGLTRMNKHKQTEQDIIVALLKITHENGLITESTYRAADRRRAAW